MLEEISQSLKRDFGNGPADESGNGPADEG